MKINVLLGLQYGDEGKGKIVDFLAPKFNMVARFQGGPNAGHTLEFDGKKHVLHQIPSGIFRSDIQNLVGNGVVLDPVILKREIQALEKMGLDLTKNLFLSKKTQIILPTHRLLDAAYEKAKGDKKIGSTLKGIGPAYQDKIGRHGLRLGDMQSTNFKSLYQEQVQRHLSILEYYKHEFNLEELEQEFFLAIEYISNYPIVDSEYMVNNALKNGEAILAEGAQGSLLDIDFGSYPFVTSSSTMTAGACVGLGAAPHSIGEVYGIVKAYTTRVGSGPFPTELHDEVGEKLRKEGNEFGSTTGRPRRCGWLDLPALKYAIMINGVTQLFLMKADVLNSFEEIKVCTHYKLADGTLTDQLPFEMGKEPLEPQYVSLKGWNQDLNDFRTYDALPHNLKDYVKYIEEALSLPINLISIGPDRTQTILK